MKKGTRIIVNSVIVLVAILVLAYFGRYRIIDLWQQWVKQASLPEPVTNVNLIVLKNENINNGNTNKLVNQEFVLPEEINLAVPFTTQAPFGNWDEQHEESCEEAAALIVHYWWQKKTFTKQIANDELQKIVDFEIKKYGDYKDTDSQETAQFIKDLWGYKRVDVKYNITIEDIKKEVAQGRPVILPTAGRELKNPNFKSPGPLYHMVVVRGYTKDKIITNDPGTRNGEEYTYSPDVLYNAIHDWNNGDIYNGKKAMIVVYPNI